MTGIALLLAAAVCGPAAGAPDAPQTDSLIAAARRAARGFQAHEFDVLVSGSPGVLVRLGGGEPSVPLGPAQAAPTLRAFAGDADELEVEVLSVREVGPAGAYAEVQRVFVVRGTSARRTQLLYFGFRRVGAGYRLVEVRLLP